jgi:hypothetical protein
VAIRQNKERLKEYRKEAYAQNPFAIEGLTLFTALHLPNNGRTSISQTKGRKER